MFFELLQGARLFGLLLFLIVVIIGFPLFLVATGRGVVYKDSGDFANAFLVWAAPFIVYIVGLVASSSLNQPKLLTLLGWFAWGLCGLFLVITVYNGVKSNGLFKGLLISPFKVLYSPMAIFSAIDFLVNSNDRNPFYFLRYVLLFGIFANINRLLIQETHKRILLKDLHPED